LNAAQIKNRKREQNDGGGRHADADPEGGFIALLLRSLTTFGNSHHPERVIAAYDLSGRPPTISMCARNFVLGLLGIEISVRINALAAALPPGLHPYCPSSANHVNRNFSTRILMAAEQREGSRGTV
jgi:hypothetical protein